MGGLEPRCPRHRVTTGGGLSARVPLRLPADCRGSPSFQSARSTPVAPPWQMCAEPSAGCEDDRVGKDSEAGSGKLGEAATSSLLRETEQRVLEAQALEEPGEAHAAVLHEVLSEAGAA